MFSAFDTEAKTYFETGINSKTKNECIFDILEFLCQFEMDMDDYTKMQSLPEDELIDIIESHGVVIEEHQEKIPTAFS